MNINMYLDTKNNILIYVYWYSWKYHTYPDIVISQLAYHIMSQRRPCHADTEIFQLDPRIKDPQGKALLFTILLQNSCETSWHIMGNPSYSAWNSIILGANL